MPSPLSPVVQAGFLRHRVTIQRATSTTDAYGQSQLSWSDIATVWGFVQPLTGRELQVATQLRADLTHTVTLRWLGRSISLYPQDRFLFKGRILNIEYVQNLDERSHTITCLCTEGAVIAPAITGTLYYGTSAATTLDEAAILALTSVAITDTWKTTYVWGAAASQFKYFCVPSSFGSVTAFTDSVTGWSIDLASTTPYTQTAGTSVRFTTVSVDGTDYSVFRSEFKLGGSIVFTVS